MNDRRNPDLQAVRQGIYDLETACAEIVALGLSDQPLNVSISNLSGVIPVPETVAEKFESVGADRPWMVEAVDAQLTYDPLSQRYKLDRGGVAFDNDFGYVASPPIYAGSDDELLHDVSVFGRGDDGNAKIASVGKYSTPTVHSFFYECGLDAPVPPSRSEFSVFASSLKAAEKAVLFSTKTTPIDIEHELVITDEQIMTNPSPEGGMATPGLTPGWLREVTVRLVSYPDYGVVTHAAVLRTDNPAEEVSFKGLYRQTVTSGDNAKPGNEKLAFPNLSVIKQINEALRSTGF